MKLLVTGISGFVGRNIITAAHNRGYEVYGIDRSIHKDIGEINVAYVDLMSRGGILDLFEHIKPDAVIHLAAESNPAESFNKGYSVLKNNIISSMNILDAVKIYKNIKLLMIGSREQYILNKDISISPYAITKQTQEYMSKYYCAEFDLQIYITRSFNHYGPFQNKQYVISSICRQTADIIEDRKDKTIVVGNPESSRDFLYIEDVIDAYFRILEKGYSGKVYDVCSGNEISIKEIIDILKEIYSIDFNIVTDDKLLRQEIKTNIDYNNDNLCNDTGWKQKTDIKTGLKNTVEWWRSNL